MMAQPGEKFQPTRRSSRLHTSLDTGTAPSLNIESQTQSLTEIQSDVENKVKASQDTIVNVVEEDSGHAKGDGSASGVEKSLFVEIELPDGRIARQCRASMDCPKRSAFITKRLRMMKHLKDCHGLEIEIKNRAGGRPLHKEAERRANEMPNPDIKGWKKAAMKRFADKDWKFKQNCQKYQRLMRIRALQLWTDIGEDYKNKSQAAFIEDFVAGKMKEYMATKSIRLAKIQKRIDEGYDTHEPLDMRCGHNCRDSGN